MLAKINVGHSKRIDKTMLKLYNYPIIIVGYDQIKRMPARYLLFQSFVQSEEYHVKSVFQNPASSWRRGNE